MVAFNHLHFVPSLRARGTLLSRLRVPIITFIAKESDARVCGPTLFAEYYRIVQIVDPSRLNGDLWLKIIKTKERKVDDH